jgi:dihydroxyacetone kinase
MVDAVLADAPPDVGSRAAVLVNGLGGTKYEEMFVLYQGIAPLLAEAGIEAYAPRVGEFVTSLEMAGCSLTLFWLDDELLALHDASADAPAFTQIGPDGGRATGGPVGRAVATAEAGAAPERQIHATASAGEEAGTPGEAGERMRAALGRVLAAIEEAEAELGRLDAAAGDGDHGLGMARGFRAAVAAVDGFRGTAAQTLARAGEAFQDAAGGASGALVGAWLLAIGRALPASDGDVDAAALGRAMAAGLVTIRRLGQADPGDKTMVDTLAPFGAALDDAVGAGRGAAEAWRAALPAAERGMRATTEMVSRRGRASRLGERSRGHQDAGATSMFLVLRALGEALDGK